MQLHHQVNMENHLLSMLLLHPLYPTNEVFVFKLRKRKFVLQQYLVRHQHFHRDQHYIDLGLNELQVDHVDEDVVVQHLYLILVYLHHENYVQQLDKYQQLQVLHDEVQDDLVQLKRLKELVEKLH